MGNQTNIFYSWQSDLPRETNHNAIKKALRSACTTTESLIEDCSIIIDEATRDEIGSPNIPLSIFKKIECSDIFICDLTTINESDKSDNRKVPNPNVLIELGYAIATLGWDRILLVYNTFYGNFPTDVPFDISGHRIITFKIRDKNDNNGIGQLTQILSTALKTIIEGAPLLPSEKKSLTPEERKRKITVDNLCWLMGHFHIPTFDDFLEHMPRVILFKIFNFKESFQGIINTSSFHLYDTELLGLIEKFEKTWDESLSFSEHYQTTAGQYSTYRIPADIFPNEESEKDFHKLTQICLRLREEFNGLLSYIRDKYLEVDLDKLSREAMDRHIEELKEIKGK